ncbi:MAG: alpha/beta hydrolase [Gammaproteobacteria bacterium]
MKLYRDFTSQEEIDRQYNVGALTPDLQAHLDRYARESEKARQELECELNIRFGPTLDETLDIFPSGKPDSPVMVFVHGGYWRRGTSKEFDFVARGLNAHDISVVVTNYALCPNVSITEITRQSRAVIAWLYQEISAFNGNPDRIFVSGHSAGGQQVGMLLSTDWLSEYGLACDIIKGGIAISGIYDLQPLPYSYLQPTLMLTHKEIMQQSPCFNIPDASPPLLVSLGERETEEFHRQAAAYVASRQSKGLDTELFIQPGEDHFTIIDGLGDAHSAFCRRVVEFISNGRL